jgi:hypothetical protein
VLLLQGLAVCGTVADDCERSIGRPRDELDRRGRETYGVTGLDDGKCRGVETAFDAIGGQGWPWWELWEEWDL